MNPVVSLRNVKKSFDGGIEFVLNGINLDIPRGSLTGIIGYSGTGKSVMLRHILGLLQPTSGEVKVFGHNLAQISREQLTQIRCRIGVLFQHAALFDDVTVIGNVCFPIKEHRWDMKQDEIFELARKKLILSGIEEKHFTKLPAELSGGMKKRVGLARALALDPEVIIYDEPTTGLDPILVEMVDNLIIKTHENHKGSTAIIVSHDLMTTLKRNDFVIMLDKGKVLLSGPPETFFTSNDKLVRKFVEKGVRNKW